MKVRVAYKTTNVIEVEVDPKYAECLRLADLPWGQFPADRINEWHDDCFKLYQDIECMMPQLDCDFEHLVTIATEDGSPIYEY